MEDQNNYEIKEPKKTNTSTIIFTTIFIILIVIIGYLTYTRVIEHTNKQNNQNTEQKQENKDNNNKKELDINSSKVLNLYDLVKSYEYYWDIKRDKEETLLVSDIKYDELFQFAMKNQNFETTIDCNDIKEEFKNKYQNSYDSVTCGDNEYIIETDSFKNYNGYISTYTKFYKEADIKKLFHQIYGNDYYQRKEIISALGIEYFYIESKQGYAIINVPTGGIGPQYEGKLLSANQSDSELSINEEVTFKNSSDEINKYLFKYIFKYNQKDDSYYFYSITKEKIEK